MKGFLKQLFSRKQNRGLVLLERPVRFRDTDALVLDAEYEPYREELFSAGLDEEVLRQMDPDDRVAALEDASLDPYDYIYLAC